MVASMANEEHLEILKKGVKESVQFGGVGKYINDRMDK